MGADMIFYPTAIGSVDGVEQVEGSWQEAWEAVQRGHAIANATAVCAVNRVGKEGKTKFWGGSFVCSQFGAILARGSDREEIVMADVEPALGKHVREGWRFFYNRRPETYDKITER
jgi:agmatine deiminase